MCDSDLVIDRCEPPAATSTPPIDLSHRGAHHCAELQAVADAAATQAADALGRRIGHDINNLMAIVLAYSDGLLEEPGLSAQQREDVTAIRDAGRRAVSLAMSLRAVVKSVAAPASEHDEQHPVADTPIEPGA